LARKARSKFGDVWELVETYCQDWEDSLMDIATFCFCLAAFHTPPKEKKDAIFDEQVILEGYHWAQFAFAAYKGEKKLVMERLPFLEDEDFVVGQWEDEFLQEAPAYYVALDHDQKSIVLALRGTKVKQDILVDLAAQFVKWRNGYVHRGFLTSLKKLEPQVLPIVETLRDKHPDYQIVVTGHSLGAAISALVVLKWVEDHPDWKIHGYGFATPCCISAHHLERSLPIFTTYVHNFDAVARLSMGSLQDLHNGMRLFARKAGNNHNALAIFQAMRKIALRTESQKIITIAGEIDSVIQKNLDSELNEGKQTNHLFPAGITYQLWREARGKNFTTWEMYKTKGQIYGRLHFSPSMLKDHGSAGYNAAFENLLALSVVERKIWLGIKASRREEIRNYWNSFSEIDPFDPSYDIAPVIENLKKESEFRKKAFEKGLIRPFLLLVSMDPKRRAAMANMTGVSLVKKDWYTQFDPHHEAYYILTSHRKGVQSRSNSSSRSLIPFKHGSNWYMILEACASKVKKNQSKFVDENIAAQFRGKKRNFRNSVGPCKDPSDPMVRRFEELVMVLFFSLVETKDIHTIAEETKASPEMKETAERLRELGFETEDFINIVAEQYTNHSSNKKANEMYAWGDIVRHDDERVKKRQVAGMAGLALLSGFLLFSAVPLVVAMPPLALVPLGASIGLGGYVATRATPGGLVSIVVGCLQQRLILAFHDVKLEDYYSAPSH